MLEYSDVTRTKDQVKIDNFRISDEELTRILGVYSDETQPARPQLAQIFRNRDKDSSSEEDGPGAIITRSGRKFKKKTWESL